MSPKGRVCSRRGAEGKAVPLAALKPPSLWGREENSAGSPAGRLTVLLAVCQWHLAHQHRSSLARGWQGNSQHNAQGTGFVFQKRKWLLLAKYEAWGGPDLSGRLSVGTFQVLLPSDSSTLLLRPVVARELLLPCSFPPLPADLPEAALAEVEVNKENRAPLQGKGHPCLPLAPTRPLPLQGVLNGLELEATYDPLLANGHLYQALKRGLGRLPASRVQRWAPRQWPRQVPRGTGGMGKGRNKQPASKEPAQEAGGAPTWLLRRANATPPPERALP